MIVNLNFLLVQLDQIICSSDSKDASEETGSLFPSGKFLGIIFPESVLSLFAPAGVTLPGLGPGSLSA